MTESSGGEPMLSHVVFFTLIDNSEAARAALVESCKTYLSDHPGTVSFSVSTRVPDLQRPVNDLEFDVALFVVFQTRADHDRYQTADKHSTFVETNESNFQQARVFDSYLS